MLSPGKSRKQAKLGGKELGRIVYSPWGRGGEENTSLQHFTLWKAILILKHLCFY